MSDSEKRGISVRLQPALMSSYSALVEGAALTPSEHVRHVVERLLGRATALAIPSPLCDLRFNRVKRPHFEELVATIQLEVPAIDIATPEALGRCIFRLPEFISNGREAFRVDSAFFQRVTGNGNAITSSATARNVLSFRLIDRRWRGSMFVYRPDVDIDAAEEQIRKALDLHIRSTIAMLALDQLPPSRMLTQEDVAAADATLFPEMISEW